MLDLRPQRSARARPEDLAWLPGRTGPSNRLVRALRARPSSVGTGESMAGPCARRGAEWLSCARGGLRHMATASPRHLSSGRYMPLTARSSAVPEALAARRSSVFPGPDGEAEELPPRCFVDPKNQRLTAVPFHRMPEIREQVSRGFVPGTPRFRPLDAFLHGPPNGGHSKGSKGSSCFMGSRGKGNGMAFPFARQNWKL